MSSSRPHLSRDEAGRKTASIARLARRAGVPPEAVRALITGDAGRLSTVAPEALASLEAYLQAGAEKPGTQEKGNRPLLHHYLRTLAQAGAAGVARALARNGEVNAYIVGARAELGVEAAKRAATSTLEGRVQALRGSERGVQLHEARAAGHRHRAVSHLKGAAEVARTEHDRDTVRLAAREAGHHARAHDRRR